MTALSKQFPYETYFEQPHALLAIVDIDSFGSATLDLNEG